SSGNLTMPVREYTHSIGLAVIGGYVYRGSVIPGEYGRYYHADNTGGQVWSMKVNHGVASEVVQRVTRSAPTAVAEDGNGDLYIVMGVTTSGGSVRKIVTNCNTVGDIDGNCAVDLNDAVILVNVLLGQPLDDLAELNRCDVNADGQKDGRDVAAWVDAFIP